MGKNKRGKKPLMMTSRSVAKAYLWGVPTTGPARLVSDGWGGHRRVGPLEKWTQWHYAVRDSTDKIVFKDDCRDYQRALKDAIAHAHAVRLLENAGHLLPYSYAELVDMAPDL